MGFTKCPKCGNEIADVALMCPKCGTQFDQKVVNGQRILKPKKKKKMWLWILIAIFVIGLLGSLGDGNEQSQETVQSDIVQNVETSEAIEENDDIEDANYLSESEESTPSEEQMSVESTEEQPPAIAKEEVEQPESENPEESVEEDAEESMEDSEGEDSEEGLEEDKESAEESSEGAVFADLEVHFLNVGQGDATLLKCGDSTMLIDTSTDDKGTAIQNYLKKQGITKLDYLILTHPDADHIGSADVIITKFEIENVFMSDFTKDNKTYNRMIEALEYKNYKWETPVVGSEYNLGDAAFKVIGPVDKYNNPNDSSIVIILSHGNNTFLFTGDAEEGAEKDLINDGNLEDVDVYHVGHHGSRSSSSSLFLDNIHPEYAVISCAEDNSYGHPHAQTLNALRSMGVSVYRTDEQGTVVVLSDGEELTWNMSPSDSWKAGEPTENSQPKEKNDTSVEEKNEEPVAETKEYQYIGNINNGKLHKITCHTLPKETNRKYFYTKEEAANAGYTDACKNCKP